MESFVLIFGRQPRLAAAEILARLQAEDPGGSRHRCVGGGRGYLRVDLEKTIDPVGLFSRLGGSVKLVRLVDDRDVSEGLTDWLGKHLLEEYPGSGRLTFGLSLYGNPGGLLIPSAAEMKHWLSEKGISSRFLKSKTEGSSVLSSAQVQKSGMLDPGGVELCLFGEGSRIFLGKTIQVQHFEDFSERDYGKPERRIDRGMLPPKLARIMLNLSGLESGSQVLDPFCGSGVLLVEGVLLGYRMTGMDLSPEAVLSSEKNLKWTRQRYGRLTECRVFRGDVRGSVKKFGPFAFDAVVSEGDLGPNLTRVFSKKSVFELVNSLKPLYITALSELRSVVRPGGRVILAVPRWRLKDGGEQGLGLRPMLRMMGYREVKWADRGRGAIPEEWVKRPLVYRRPEQKTAREILWLEV